MSNIHFNGNIIPSVALNINQENRAFRYGDALFETLLLANGKINLIHSHFKRLTRSMETLKMTIPPEFSVDFFNRSILGLSKMNRTGPQARIRITIYRNEGGLYAPTTHSVSWLIECNPLTGDPLSLNKEGLNLGIFEEIFKPINKLSNLKTANGLIFVMAGIFKIENALDEAVLLNDSLNIVEAISSNIFIVKNRVLYTPALNQGCVAGVMRAEIIRKVMAEKINCFEAIISKEDLLNADEVFLTNAILGIQWISQIQKTNYSNRFTKCIKEM